jgi:hypothetical protein
MKQNIMKLLLILVIASVVAVDTNAQQINKMYQRKPWEETKLKWLLSDTLSRLNLVPNVKTVQPRQVKDGVYHVPINGVYLGDNGRGDEIYAMQPDNMPCLVPGKRFVSEMPIVGMEKNDKNLPLLQKPEKKPVE